MEWGRRRDLGFVLSLGFGLYLTHKIACMGRIPVLKQSPVDNDRLSTDC